MELTILVSRVMERWEEGKAGIWEGYNEGRLKWQIGIRGKLVCGNIKIKCLSLSKSYPSTPSNLD